MNRNGNVQSLPLAELGNTRASKHNVYSPRLREPRAQEIAEQVLAAPHVSALDAIGAAEIGRLEALIEVLDESIAQRGAVNSRAGTVRALIDLHLRASRRLGEWLDRYGLTPRGRADWVRTLGGSGTLADEMQRIREARELEA